MDTKKISPAAMMALRKALTDIYWYKDDLRKFLTSALGGPGLLSGLNWDDYKRNVAGELVDRLERSTADQGRLLQLIAAVGGVEDFAHLERLEGGKAKAAAARVSVLALRKLSDGHAALTVERRKVEERREAAAERQRRASAVQQQLEDLRRDYVALVGCGEPQKRGYLLEAHIRRLFEVFDLDPRASFKLEGEQIDGAFTFEAFDYLLECKWQQAPVDCGDLDVLAGKLSRKLENTLGVFLSIGGFSGAGVKAHSSGRRMMFLMDGADLMAVLEDRIELPQLLRRKRREASQTGNIYLRAAEMF